MPIRLCGAPLGLCTGVCNSDLPGDACCVRVLQVRSDGLRRTLGQAALEYAIVALRTSLSSPFSRMTLMCAGLLFHLVLCPVS